MALAYALAEASPPGYRARCCRMRCRTGWVLGTFSLFFVLMAGAMFGFYQFQLPSSVQSALAERSNRPHGGHIGSVI